MQHKSYTTKPALGEAVARLSMYLQRLGGGLRHMVWRLAVCCVFVEALSGAASAQILSEQQRAQLQVQKAQLFQRMLGNPADIGAALAYADVAARLGDNEAAVAALERLLLFNPNLSRADLELGALYFRMGSYAVARIYFERVLAAKPSPEIRARVNRYLNEIALQLSPQRLIGFAFAGVQYQSDANVATSAPLINSPIGPVLLNSQFVKHGDEDIFASGALLYSYDLGTQNSDKVEVGGTAFANHYFRFLRLDLDLAEVTAGPRFNFPSPMEGVKASSVKPYLIVNEVGLGLSQYFYTYGFGIESTALLPEDFALKGVFEFRQKNFSNAPERPVSTGLDGNDKVVSLILKKPVTSNSEVNLEFDFLDQQTRFPFYSNQGYALSGSYRIRYDDPTRTLRFPWESAIFVGYLRDDYDSPDPCCNTSSSPGIVTLSDRRDRRWRFGVSQLFQVASNVAIVLQVQRDVAGSNLPLYAYTSNSVLVGPQIRF